MGLVRLFLALVVAADHWRIFVLVPAGKGDEISDVYKLGFNAGYAVMFFYAISGFLITYTLTRNYRPDVRGAVDFYRKRFIRIFALYWPLVLVAFLLVPWAWGAFIAAGPLQKFSAIFLIGLDWQLAAAWPAPMIGGLSQAWTLGAELVFYLLAPLIVRSWKIGVALLVVSFGFRLAFTLVNGVAIHTQWTYTFPVATFGFFMVGHLACLASQQWRILSSPYLGWLSLAASAASMTWAGNYADFDGTRFWLSVTFFTLALPGVFAATSRIRWMNAVGDLSYPVYLVHLLPLMVAGPLVAEAAAMISPSANVSTACFAVVVLACAVVAHHAIERPVAYLMSKALLRRVPAAA